MSETNTQIQSVNGVGSSCAVHNNNNNIIKQQAATRKLSPTKGNNLIRRKELKTPNNRINLNWRISSAVTAGLLI